MLKNYFLTAIRAFWRNKAFSLINVLGLSIGISAALVIFLIVYYEFSFDRFEKDGDRIYRVVLDAKFNGMEGHSAGVQAPLSAAVANELTGIEGTVPVMTFQGDASASVSITRDNANAVLYKKQAGVVFTNPDYFRVLSYQWIAGSQQAALQQPFAVVLTESRASHYFPGVAAADIIGRPIEYNKNIIAKVTGIVQDLNRQTIFTSSEFLSFATIAKTNLQQNFMMDVWNDWMVYSSCYLKLSANTGAAAAEEQLNQLLKKYNKDAYRDDNNNMRFHLQPLHDIHFNPLYQSFNTRVASRTTLYGLLAIGSFLLLLGCINFINLTTAQSARRAKEIGIRKTMGGARWQLVTQFLGETFIIVIVATLFSVALTPLLLNIFKDFMPPGMKIDLLGQPVIILFLLLLAIIVSLLSGFYPALVLAGYKPVSALKNQSYAYNGQTRSAWVRQTLTVSQFVIAQFFVIATLMVAKQINYSLTAELGFQKDAVINFNIPRDTLPSHLPQLLATIKTIPGIAVASTGFMAPADEGVAFTRIACDNGKEEIIPDVNVQLRWGNPEYLQVYQIPLVAGRNTAPSDTTREFLVNETYAHALGFQQAGDAVGKQLVWNNKHVPIVGVIKDFHDQSMRAEVSAMVLGGANGSTFHIKLQPDRTSWKQTIERLQQAYTTMYPDEEFNYKFLDETIAKFYAAEKQTASLLSWATGLAILISCLGLLGLVMYTTTTRTKEIGIRKILGASVLNIVSILSKDFMRLVILAFLIATPLAWWAVYKWLQNFAYKTSMSWWIFAISGLAICLVAMLTLSLQTIKTARSNPAQRLRTE
jgi:putative ABC transport system permease protein